VSGDGSGVNAGGSDVNGRLDGNRLLDVSPAVSGDSSVNVGGSDVNVGGSAVNVSALFSEG